MSNLRRGSNALNDYIQEIPEKSQVYGAIGAIARKRNSIFIFILIYIFAFILALE